MRRLGPVRDFRGKEYDVALCAPGERGLRGFQRVACVSPNDFLRSALLNGLQDELAIGGYAAPAELGVANHGNHPPCGPVAHPMQAQVVLHQ